MKKLSRTTKEAIKKHGLNNCLAAYHKNEVEGNGAKIIREDFNVTTRQCDAMINAGREYTEISFERCDV